MIEPWTTSKLHWCTRLSCKNIAHWRSIVYDTILIMAINVNTDYYWKSDVYFNRDKYFPKQFPNFLKKVLRHISAKLINNKLKDCKRNKRSIKWPSIKRWQSPIHDGNLKSWPSMNKIFMFIILKFDISNCRFS